MTTMPETAIIFGASGFVGRNIVDALQGDVSTLIAVTGSGAAVPGCTMSIAMADLDSLPGLPAATSIIHVAARRYHAASFRDDQSRILDQNVSITNAVYAFAASRGIKEIRQASSAAIYPSFFDILDDERPFTWNDWPHEGEAAYAWSKRWGEIIAEHYRRNHGIHTLSFRLSNPYGPYDTTDIAAAHVATAFALRALEPGPDFVIRGNPDAERDFVFAGDVASVFKASLALAGIHDSLNLGFGETISVRAAGGCSRRRLRHGETDRGRGVAGRRGRGPPHGDEQAPPHVSRHRLPHASPGFCRDAQLVSWGVSFVMSTGPSSSDMTLILGSDGFLGRHFCRYFAERGWPFHAIGRAAGDFSQRENVERAFRAAPEATRILHLITHQRTGPVQYDIPGSLLFENANIHLNVLECWRLHQPQAKLISTGSSCAYPESDAPLPEAAFPERACA